MADKRERIKLMIPRGQEALFALAMGLPASTPLNGGEIEVLTKKQHEKRVEALKGAE